MVSSITTFKAFSMRKAQFIWWTVTARLTKVQADFMFPANIFKVCLCFETNDFHIIPMAILLVGNTICCSFALVQASSIYVAHLFCLTVSISLTLWMTNILIARKFSSGYYNSCISWLPAWKFIINILEIHGQLPVTVLWIGTIIINLTIFFALGAGWTFIPFQTVIVGLTIREAKLWRRAVEFFQML